MLQNSIKQCLYDASLRLQATSDSARIDAEVLLAHILEKDRAYLFTWPEKILTPEQLTTWQAFVERRIKGEPVAYILGEKEFWSLDLYSDPSTLIPRGDTEILVEKALELLGEGQKRILDLGTGTGAIALAIASERRESIIDAVDFSHNAVALAEKNKTRHKLNHVNIFHSDWFDNVEHHYDMIVSNPPYIDEQDEHLQQGDVVFEPHSALIAKDEGLADIIHIAEQALNYLLPEGYLLVEHGWKQKQSVQDIFQQAGFANISTIQDYAGNDRVTLGQKL